MSYKCLAFAGQEDFLWNIVHLSNDGSMLGQRRRRWPNIKTALDQCLVWVVSCNQFSGYINAVNLYSIGYCWPKLDRPRHARFEAEWFFNVSPLPTCCSAQRKLTFDIGISHFECNGSCIHCRKISSHMWQDTVWEVFARAFTKAVPVLWNTLTPNIKSVPALTLLKSIFKKSFLES